MLNNTYYHHTEKDKYVVLTRIYNDNVCTYMHYMMTTY